MEIIFIGIFIKKCKNKVRKELLQLRSYSFHNNQLKKFEQHNLIYAHVKFE